jgi:4-hydroxybenzoate polyprenyltransferase
MSHSRVLFRALRPHQWLKNLLVLVPVIAAHRIDRANVLVAVAAFASFSLCASGGYVLNDLLDLAADRQHERKRHRPFASAALSTRTGMILLAVALSAGFGLAAMILPPAFSAVMGAYLLGTTAYSIGLKTQPVLDVIVLAGLYVIRVFAGGVAGGIYISNWLLAFTLFLSLSLAFLKRFIEVREHRRRDVAEVPGRGYRADDMEWLHSAGLSSAYLSVVVLAIYANSGDAARLYSHPDRLLFNCPVLLYWATRVWLRAHRGELHDDPVVAVSLDPATYIVGTVAMAFVAIAA